MLNPDELREALHDAEKAAACCTRFCRVVGEYSDDNRYRLSHNGLGRRDTDSQVVHSTPVLALNKEQLAVKVQAWIEGLHKGERPDLNAAMETETPFNAEEAARGLQELFDAGLSLEERALLARQRGPAMTGWPWTVGDYRATIALNAASTWHWTDGTRP